MAKLLFIDTSATIATVAVSSNGSLVASRIHENSHEQASVINFMIEEALAKASIKIQELDAICVCAGPGSYTGLRVGLSTAKGLAYAAELPIMLFNRLDMLSWSQVMDHKFVIALKARIGEYFVASFDKMGSTLGEAHHAFESDLQKYKDDGFEFITDDEALSISSTKTIIRMDTAVDINMWIVKATERYHSNKFDDLAYSEPFYMKAAYTTQSKK